MQNVKIAIIGAGYTATEHAKAFADLSGVTLAGIYSRTRPRAEALAETYHIDKVFDSIDALFAGTQADLVIITVNELSMKAVCLASLEHPWTLFVEKPPGLHLAEAQEIEAAAHSKNRNVFVALNRRFYSSTLAALNDLNQSDEPRYIYVQDQEDRDRARAVGRDDEVLRYWMYANSIHMVDYLRIFGRGDVVAVNIIYPWQNTSPGLVTAAVAFSSGDRAVYEALWELPGPWAVSITTATRRWELRPVEDATYQNAGERQRHEHARDDLDKTYKPGFRRQAEAVVATLRGEASTVPTIADTVKTMSLIEQIYTE